MHFLKTIIFFVVIYYFQVIGLSEKISQPSVLQIKKEHLIKKLNETINNISEKKKIIETIKKLQSDLNDNKSKMADYYDNTIKKNIKNIFNKLKKDEIGIKIDSNKKIKEVNDKIISIKTNANNNINIINSLKSENLENYNDLINIKNNYTKYLNTKREAFTDKYNNLEQFKTDLKKLKADTIKIQNNIKNLDVLKKIYHTQKEKIETEINTITTTKNMYSEYIREYNRIYEFKEKRLSYLSTAYENKINKINDLLFLNKINYYKLRNITLAYINRNYIDNKKFINYRRYNITNNNLIKLEDLSLNITNNYFSNYTNNVIKEENSTDKYYLNSYKSLEESLINNINKIISQN